MSLVVTLLTWKTKSQKQKMHSTPFAPPLCHVVALNRDSSLCKQTVIVFFPISMGIELDPKLLNYKCCHASLFHSPFVMTYQCASAPFVPETFSNHMNPAEQQLKTCKWKLAIWIILTLSQKSIAVKSCNDSAGS